MIKTVYLDMDGVIADLGTWYENRYGIIPREDPNHRNNWPDAVRYGMFRLLPFLEDSREMVYRLMNSGVEVIILSCATKANYELVSYHKTEWLKDHGLSKFKAIFTKTKAEKAYYAAPDRLLIDDSPGCVEPYAMAGGPVILHKSGKETIEQLEKMGVI
jgi:5'(3')-deoxyribonucleotidase